jgi:beta-catenin-like protein 1
MSLYASNSIATQIPYTQIRAHLQQMLGRKSKSLSDIARVLKIYHDNIDDELPDGEARPASQKEILEALIAFLEGC